MPAALKLEVVVFTHNHEAFVEGTLKSILAQQTDFEIGIRIHDDCSTDQTVDVIRATLAETKVPWQLVQPPSNRYADGTSFYHEFIAESAAEYAAILDGDDYWIDETKLQRQVELLDRHPNAALCHHPVLELIGEELKPVDWPPPYARVEVMPGSRLSVQNVISSSSVVVRTALFPKVMPGGYNVLGIGDYPMWALATAGYEIAFIDCVMSAYRVHATNLYASLDWERRFDRELEARIYISNFVAEEFRKTWREGIVTALKYRLNADGAALKAELDARTAELEGDRQEIHNILTSTSWRVTAPLRAIASALRRSRSAPGRGAELGDANDMKE